MIEHLQAIAVHGYYAGEIDAGRRACERILATPDLPPDVDAQARQNRTWYTQSLEELLPCRFLPIDIEPARPNWSLFNPSLIVHDGQLLGVVRSSNYKIQSGQYVMPPADGKTIHTENILVAYAADLLPASTSVLAVEYPETGYPVYGLEDCRLRTANGVLGLSCTVRNVAPFDGRCRIAIGAIDRPGSRVTGLRVLDGLKTQEHEKNWMPIEGRGGWLYASNHSGHVVTVDPDPSLAGGYQICRRRAAPPIAKHFRGGSQLIPFRGGWLSLIHETAYLPQGRVYEHRWVWFDGGLGLAQVSPAFYFLERQAIEFAAGLVAIGDQLVASFGVRDAEAWLVELEAEDVWRLLSPATSV
jgi:hypothetical protein